MRWRLITDKEQDAFSNMAVDEAIMLSGRPTLRLYQWKPAAVSIGYFQSMEQEVDLAQCRLHNVDFIRRITGGGAVFHEHELTYSLACPEHYVPRKIIDSYEMICGAVAGALRLSGIDARFHPINDIITNGKKISGSAQTRKQGMVLQHGTIIIDVDVDKMFSILKVPDEKIRDKMIKNVRDRVTSLKNELGTVDIHFIIDNIQRSFEDMFSAEFTSGQLSPDESALAAKLRERFMSREWNFLR